MNQIKWITCLFLIASSLSLRSDRNHNPVTRSSAATEAKLDTVNANLETLATSLTTIISSNSAIASNTSTTAANTASSSGSTATTVTLKNLGGADHDDSGIAYWDYPLNITTATTGNTFKLSENIRLNSIANLTAESAAIVIGKDNVTIDMCGQTLYLDSSITATVIHGIYIKPGIKGTQIISSTQNVNYKGIVQDFTGYGINLIGTTGASTVVKHTNIDNVACSYNAQGIHAEFADNTSITNSGCIGNTHTTDSAYGIYMKDVNDTTINNVACNGNYSGKNAYGIYLENSVNATAENCTANANYSTATVAGAFGSSYGIHITSSGASTVSSSSNNLINCIANENYHTSNTGVTDQESAGIILTKVTAASSTTEANNIENCTTRRNISKAGTAAIALGYGIKLNTSDKNEIKSCVSSYNTTTGIIDLLSQSTSFFTSNLCFHNASNYNINFKVQLGTGTGTSQIRTVKIYVGDHIALENALQGYANIEIIT